MERFEAGKVYMGRYVCNADMSVRIHVKKRTPKTIVYVHGITGETKRRKIKEGRDTEVIQEGPGISIRAKDCLG